MTLWAMLRSPLMFGGDLPSNDKSTNSLITNSEILAVNKHSTNNHELFNRDDQITWVADVPGSWDKYVAVFNLKDGAAEKIKIRWSDLGLKSSKCLV